MARFQCTEQIASITFFNGPSGQRYESVRGQSFDVDNTMDVEHFAKNSSFKKLGVLSKTVKVASEEDKLEALLVKAKIDKSSTKAILEAYETVDNLRADLERGADELPQLKLNKKEVSAIKKLLKLE